VFPLLIFSYIYSPTRSFLFGKIKQFVNKPIFMTPYTFQKFHPKELKIPSYSRGMNPLLPSLFYNIFYLNIQSPLVPGPKALSPQFTLQYILFKYSTPLLPGHEMPVTSTECTT
jgi:hypothetical protein